MKLYNYIISVNINGKSGKKFSVVEFIDATNKKEAIAIFRKQLEDEGFVCGGWNYCDLVE